MPKIIEHDGRKYEHVKDATPTSCVKCIAEHDPELCGTLGAHCDDGHFISAKEEE